MNLREIPLSTPDGQQVTLSDYAGQAVLVVNVASKCGFTPQYAALQSLYEKYGERGLTVLGLPCNQFMGQEPGGAEQIAEFCELNYGVTFPVLEKIKVNGKHKHPLYEVLSEAPDANGKSGRVKWNFEKFVIAPDDTITRFRSGVKPDSPEVVAAIEAALPPAV